MKLFKRLNFMDPFTTCVLLFFLLPILAVYIQQSWPRLLKSLPPSPSPALPMIGHLHLLGRTPHLSLQAMARKHGSIILLWLGTIPLIVVSSASAAKEVLKDKDLTFASRPYLSAGEVGYNFVGVSVVPYGEHWKSIRKLLTLELFTAKRIDSFLWIRLEELSHMLAAVVRVHEKGQSLDMRNLLTTFTFNITTRMLMSKRYFHHDGEDGEDADSSEALLFNEVLTELVGILLQFHISEFVPPFLRWIDWSLYRMRKLHVKLDGFLRKVVDEHKEKTSGSTKVDFIGLMLELLKEHPRGEDVIKAVTTELISGGTDTSATTLEWAFAEILCNSPEILQRAQEELDTIVGRNRKVEESDLPKLVYLQAITKEVFRLHPPLPILVPHMSMQACTIAGYHVPKGATTLVNAYAIGRDPALWEEPLKFRPERFLGSQMDVKGQDFTLLPFGSGRRQCPAMGLGLKTVQIVLANLIHGFNWKAVEDQPSLEETSGAVIWLKKPLRAVASPRLSLEVLTS